MVPSPVEERVRVRSKPQDPLSFRVNVPRTNVRGSDGEILLGVNPGLPLLRKKAIKSG